MNSRLPCQDYLIHNYGHEKGPHQSTLHKNCLRKFPRRNLHVSGLQHTANATENNRVVSQNTAHTQPGLHKRRPAYFSKEMFVSTLIKKKGLRSQHTIQ